jgi:hypothetical protein
MYFERCEKYAYRIYGLNVFSDAPLDELVPTWPKTSPDIRVRFSNARNRFLSPERWCMTWTLPNGVPWLLCAKTDRSHLLRFPGLADFVVEASGEHIYCIADRGVPTNTLSHLLLDQVLPLVLSLTGREALHGAAVLTPFGVCVFAGASGVGKSTLASNFLLSGYPVLSDDCVVLTEQGGQIVAVPAYPGLRLWDDACEAMHLNREACLPVAHYSPKKRLLSLNGSNRFPAEPHRVTRIYSLVRQTNDEPQSRESKPVLEHLSSRDGFMELVHFAFRLDVRDKATLLRQFHALGRVACSISLRRLHIPNDFSFLPAVREAIIADLKASIQVTR